MDWQLSRVISEEKIPTKEEDPKTYYNRDYYMRIRDGYIRNQITILACGGCDLLFKMFHKLSVQHAVKGIEKMKPIKQQQQQQQNFQKPMEILLKDKKSSDDKEGASVTSD